MANSEFEAMIFDLDGTAVPSRANGMPSQAVIENVKLAQEQGVKMSSASGRSMNMCLDIWRALALKDPCITSGGAKIVHPQTEQILWEQPVPYLAIPEIIRICRESSILGLYITETAFDFKQELTDQVQSSSVVVEGVKDEDGELLLSRFLQIPNLAVHKLLSWSDRPFDIHITHELGTKEHAVDKLIEILGVKKVIKVGDGPNDLPLFRGRGYKVAMGNAVPELKAEADFVTDTVDNDGLARVIREMILQ